MEQDPATEKNDAQWLYHSGEKLKECMTGMHYAMLGTTLYCLWNVERL